MIAGETRLPNAVGQWHKPPLARTGALGSCRCRRLPGTGFSYGDLKRRPLQQPVRHISAPPAQRRSASRHSALLRLPPFIHPPLWFLILISFAFSKKQTSSSASSLTHTHGKKLNSTTRHKNTDLRRRRQRLDLL